MPCVKPWLLCTKEPVLLDINSNIYNNADVGFVDTFYLIQCFGEILQEIEVSSSGIFYDE